MLLALGLCSASCRQSQALRQASPIGIKVVSISCKKLAEKMIKMGSGNDEVVLLVFYQTAGKPIALLWHSRVLLFQAEGEQQVLEHQIELLPTQPAGDLIFVLLEQDTERSAAALADFVWKQLREKQSEAALETALEDDDLLGIIKSPYPSAAENTPLRFWGLHLFDEYEYWVNWQLIQP